MPEGPEVKRTGRGLQRRAGSVITEVTITSGRYTRNPIKDLEKLVGSTLIDVSVKGKLISLHLEKAGDKFGALSTLGMTGWWNPSYRVPDSRIDKYKRLMMSFEDGEVGAYFDPRNFGTFKVVTIDEMARKLQELGPDILSIPRTWMTIEVPQFYERVRRFGKKATVAEALLDQRIAAGSGNYIRADAMYLARTAPKRLISSLTEKELYRLWRALFAVARSAELDHHPGVDLDDGEHDDLNEELASHPFTNLVYNRHRSILGGVVEKYVDKGGRTVWWSPTEQA